MVVTALAQKMETGTLLERIVAKLRGVLLDGELGDGARIPRRSSTCASGNSRTPSREALKVLAAEGFVELRPNRGSIVAPIDPVEVAHVFELKVRDRAHNRPARRSAGRRRRIVRGSSRRMPSSAPSPIPRPMPALNQEFHRALAGRHLTARSSSADLRQPAEAGCCGCASWSAGTGDARGAVLRRAREHHGRLPRRRAAWIPRRAAGEHNRLTTLRQ